MISPSPGAGGAERDVGALVRAGAALRHGDGGELAGGTELRHAGHVVTLSNAQLCAISNTLC